MQPNARAALGALLTKTPGLRSEIEARAGRVLHRDFHVLRHPVPRTRDWPWSSDWTVGHTWPPKGPTEIDFYAASGIESDPKIPFELSRFAFLTQVALAAAVAPDATQSAPYLDFVREVIDDWRSANPPGQSMNWYPMEVSVRCLALAQLHDLLILAEAPESDLARVRSLMALSAAYVEVNHERSAISNSHYLSNLACLAVAGVMLAGPALSTARWLTRARDGLSREIPAQFNVDGGNFEGSTSYHLASLELCLLARLALDRAGQRLDPIAEARLKEAVRYAAHIADDTHRVPLFGDFDESTYLTLDIADPRDVRPALSFGTSLLYCENLPARPNLPGHQISSLLFSGERAHDRAMPKTPVTFCFPDTGLVGIRCSDLYLAMDAGPVGLAGAGGHGHNDLTGFVFRADGRDLIVDRGCPSYTRNRKLRNVARAGPSHAIMLMGDTDLGGLEEGPFHISHPASPMAGPELSVRDGRYILKCSHDGFTKSGAGTVLSRTLELDPTAWRLSCTDQLTPVAGPHEHMPVHRYFPIAPGLETTLATDGTGATLACPETGATWQMNWTPVGTACLLCQPHYHGYDRADDALTLCITHEPGATAPTLFTWVFSPAG